MLTFHEAHDYLDTSFEPCIPSTGIGKPSLSLACQLTSVVRFAVLRQPPPVSRDLICRLFMLGRVFLYRFVYPQAEPAPVCDQDHLE